MEKALLKTFCLTNLSHGTSASTSFSTIKILGTFISKCFTHIAGSFSLTTQRNVHRRVKCFKDIVVVSGKEEESKRLLEESGDLAAVDFEECGAPRSKPGSWNSAHFPHGASLRLC